MNDDSVDYMFQMPEGVSTKTFKNQVQHMVKQFCTELESAVRVSNGSLRSTSRIDLLEVIMCGDQSELSRQTIHLAGKARRFTLGDGDLSTPVGRQKLFQVMISQRPRHVWYSPVCKPWCMWSQFNAMKPLIQNETIFQERLANLWQISLGIVLFEYQREINQSFHHEQPKGPSMLQVPGAQVNRENTMSCCFDFCTVGQLRDPSNGLPMRKSLNVQSTSQVLHHELHGQRCSGNHEHQQIAGSTIANGQPMLRSKFSEHYPAKFARQVAKILLKDRSKFVVALVETAEEHPTKKRQLSGKMNTATIEARFSEHPWKSVMLADRMARRVGTLVVETGPLIGQVQSLCPEHTVKHVVLCRGTDRHVGPNKPLLKGEAAERRMIYPAQT